MTVTKQKEQERETESEKLIAELSSKSCSGDII